jgi:hypothetical protein
MKTTFVRKTVEIAIGEKKIVLTALNLAELQQLQELNSQIKELGGVRYIE